MPDYHVKRHFLTSHLAMIKQTDFSLIFFFICNALALNSRLFLSFKEYRYNHRLFSYLGKQQVKHAQ
jgi:hypothetical protein